MSKESICYVDEAGRPTGETAEKYSAHNRNTRRHLAFSIYLFDGSGNVLLTRRADSKKVWPGFLTGSCCGHPMPGESFEQAIRRRCEYELGCTEIEKIKCLVEDYSYTSPEFNGIVENEFCPVFIGKTERVSLALNLKEVSDAQWVSWQKFKDMQTEKPNEFSYWCKQQTHLIDRLTRQNIETGY